MYRLSASSSASLAMPSPLTCVMTMSLTRCGFVFFPVSRIAARLNVRLSSLTVHGSPFGRVNTKSCVGARAARCPQPL